MTVNPLRVIVAQRDLRVAGEVVQRDIGRAFARLEQLPEGTEIVNIVLGRERRVVVTLHSVYLIIYPRVVLPEAML